MRILFTSTFSVAQDGATKGVRKRYGMERLLLGEVLTPYWTPQLNLQLDW